MDEPDMQYAPDLGLDRHEWESEWASLEPQMVDSPLEALPEVCDLVEQMLRERGYPIDEPATAAGIDPEVLLEFREARRVARLAADGGDVAPGDAGSALAGLRNLYEHLVDEPRNG